MELDWNLFECEIRSAVVRIARQVVADHPKQSFYGLALEATASDGTDEPEALEVPVLALNSEEALARDKREETGEVRAFDAEVLREHRLREMTPGLDDDGPRQGAADAGEPEGAHLDGSGAGEAGLNGSAPHGPGDDDPSRGAGRRGDAVRGAAGGDDGGTAGGRGAGARPDPASEPGADPEADLDAELEAELDAELDGVAADIALQEAVDEDFDEGSGYYSRRWDPTDWHWCSMDLFDDGHAEAWNERLAGAVVELGWEEAARKYYRVLIDAVVAAREELARKRLPLVAFVSDSDHADELLRRCLTPEQLARHFPDLEPLELDAETV
ncbi:DUF4303 domain-containing protein [Zhihengliuella sp.]|uniref:DUF4303 domain-containing protein n=1 Tax=Zhihengliuella sp. TaxID=1954483 RepID=UPI0028112536|nr:DUF4303 domain-containing protein [Zhihengliuella sp.]